MIKEPNHEIVEENNILFLLRNGSPVRCPFSEAHLSQTTYEVDNTAVLKPGEKIMPKQHTHFQHAQCCSNCALFHININNEGVILLRQSCTVNMPIKL